ncbi:O-antigen ligase family protein [Rhodococcus rhodochrous]|uniref:O-antigen ligase family protein n=1 Tax=Rhodococcus rhodochrous TaxID=1829 RepID=UPI0032DF070C
MLVSLRSPIMPSVINVSAVLIGVALAVAVVASPRGTLARMRVTALDVVFISYFVIRVVVEFINSTDFSVSFGSGTVLDLGLGYLALLACRIVVSSTDSFFMVLMGVAVPGVIVAAIAVVQIVGPPEISNFLIQRFSSGGLETRISAGWEIRGTSTIGHWTALGGYLSFIAAIFAAKIVADQNRGHVNRWIWAGLVVVLMGQVSTLTFATIAMTAVVVAVMLYRIGVRPAHLFVALSAAIVVWSTLGEMLASRLDKQTYASSAGTQEYPLLPESVAFRVNVWINESIPAIFERPLTGWGIGTYRRFGTPASSDYLRWISPESEWIRTAVTAGIPTLLWQIVLLATVVVVMKRLCSSVNGRFVDPLFAAVITLLIASFIHSHIANRGVPLVLWPVVGACIALAMVSSKKEASTGEKGEL